MNAAVLSSLRQMLILSVLSLVAWGCGGNGGGDGTTVGIPPPAPAPAPPGGISNATPVAYADAESLFAAITAVVIPANGRPVVDFQVTDGQNTAIVNVTAADVRFIIAKLQESPSGTYQGVWQSYINRVEQPGIGPGTEPRLQATLERGTSGTFTNNADGTYRYQFATAINDPDSLSTVICAQATAEGLDLSYNPMLTHRLAMQFDNAKVALNPTYDFQPATGAVDQIPRGLVTATASCNQCHGDLALHGGGRVEIDYCVTCHNPGSGDANSGNSVAFNEMVHKIHRGANLPSIQSGGSYGIYGFNDALHDYSDVRYPQDIRHCTECHAGSATEDGRSTTTVNGDNWTEFPSQNACGSCHDEVDFSTHFGGQPDDEDCRGCHSVGGAANSIPESHAIPAESAARYFAFEIVDVTETAAGEFPVVDFRVVDPTNANEPYDIKTHPAFTQIGGASRLAVTLAWSTSDYTNTRPNANSSSSLSIDALSQSTALGSSIFRVISTEPIPDGASPPFFAASGSGAATIEGHPAMDVDPASAGFETIPVTNTVRYYSIDEPTGSAVPRRQGVDIARCNVCHAKLALHGDNRTDSIEGCVTCHNPRNTDRSSREIALTPPDDGKSEESLDFKTMIHGIHAAGMRENALQLVGFRGFSTHIYDGTSVHYPRRIDDCAACHIGDSFTLPLAIGVLGTTVRTAADRSSPADDIVSSPISTVCSSCHDGLSVRAHMESNGGDFETTQVFLDSGITVENCLMCHGPGTIADIEAVHRVAP